MPSPKAKANKFAQKRDMDLGLAIACVRAQQIGPRPWRLEEVAAYADCTRERIRQIEFNALQKISKYHAHKFDHDQYRTPVALQLRARNASEPRADVKATNHHQRSRAQGAGAANRADIQPTSA